MVGHLRFDSPDHFTEFATYAAHDAVWKPTVESGEILHHQKDGWVETIWNPVKDGISNLSTHQKDGWNHAETLLKNWMFTTVENG